MLRLLLFLFFLLAFFTEVISSEITREFFWPHEQTKYADLSSQFPKDIVTHLITSDEYTIFKRRKHQSYKNDFYIIYKEEEPKLISENVSSIINEWDEDGQKLVLSKKESESPFKNTFYEYDTKTGLTNELSLTDIKGVYKNLDEIVVQNGCVIAGKKFVDNKNEFWVNTLIKGWVLFAIYDHTTCSAPPSLEWVDKTLLYVDNCSEKIDLVTGKGYWINMGTYDPQKQYEAFTYGDGVLPHQAYRKDGKRQWVGGSVFKHFYDDIVKKAKEVLKNKEFYLEYLVCNAFSLSWPVVITLAKEPPIQATYDVNKGVLTIPEPGDDENNRRKVFAQKADSLSEKVFGTVTALDGFVIPYFLSCPPQKKKPYPTILLVHGGPDAEDVWGYDPQVQHLAARGYAVLQVNFRGSTESSWQQSASQWGKAMQQDLYTVLEALIDQKVIDPDNVAIMGMSYGGYAALVSVTHGNDFKAKGFSGFKCAISGAAPTCLESMIEDARKECDPAHMSLLMRKILPDFPKDGGILSYQQKELLRKVSPLYSTNVMCPVLLLHGTNDVRVPEYHSRLFSSKLNKAGIEHTYITLDEEHGATSPGDNRALAYLIEAFLNNHLKGGSVQKPDFTDVAYSTVRFVCGEKNFPEFAELLKKYRGWGSLRIRPEGLNFTSQSPSFIFFQTNPDRLALVLYRDPSYFLFELWLREFFRSYLGVVLEKLVPVLNSRK